MFPDHPLQVQDWPCRQYILTMLPKTAKAELTFTPLTFKFQGCIERSKQQVRRDHQVYSFLCDQMRKLRPTEGLYLPQVTQLRGQRWQSPLLPWTPSRGRFPLRSHRHLTAFWNLENLPKLPFQCIFSICYKSNHHFLTLNLCQALLEVLSAN